VSQVNYDRERELVTITGPLEVTVIFTTSEGVGLFTRSEILSPGQSLTVDYPEEGLKVKMS
jgi:hypothetical protein